MLSKITVNAKENNFSCQYLESDHNANVWQGMTRGATCMKAQGVYHVWCEYSEGAKYSEWSVATSLRRARRHAAAAARLPWDRDAAGTLW